MNIYVGNLPWSIDDAVKLGGLTTPSRSSELNSGIKTGKLIKATVCDAPVLFDNKEERK